MNRSKVLIVLGLIATVFVGQSASAQVVLTNIASARAKAIGDTVLIRGIVTLSGLRPVYVQDSTAGIAAYSGAGLTDGFATGDSVQIQGVLKNYNSLLELDPVLSVSVLGAGLPGPVPQIIAIGSVGEIHESELIKVEGVHFVQSGSFASGNYSVTNGTTTLAVRINSGSPLIGTPIPAGSIDAIGVLGQYSFSDPSAGYQLTPRTAEDLQPLPGPRIISGPTVDSVFADGFRVRWSTLDPGSTILRFGPYETTTDTVAFEDLSLEHTVTISGLPSGRVYTFTAESENTNGVSGSSKKYAVTTSPQSSGVMTAYFNYPVDSALPLPETANGAQNLASHLLARIDAAARTIDLALYSFNDATSDPDVAVTVAQSLITAKNRGVSVRMVHDNRPTYAPLQSLIDAGIPVVKRDLTSGIMHNKFWVFDGRDTLDPSDDWVVTGSWNMTDVGTYADAQNALFVQDQSLAAIYTKEFNEMFGSTSTTPGVGRFGPAKFDDTPHITLVGNALVEVFFSPSDATTAQINRTLNTAQNNIFFGLLTFTRDDIRDVILAKKSQGVVVKGILNSSSDQGSEYATLLANGVDILIESNSVVDGQFHHKYAIVDPFNEGNDPIVLTGSHNWSTAAETDNDENTVIVHSGSLARQYVREFSKRYAESGGTGQVVSVEGSAFDAPRSFVLSEAFPNPFNPSTQFALTVPTSSRINVTVYDMLGRRVETLIDGHFESGTYAVRWSPTAVSGTYFIVLKTPTSAIARRAVFVR